MMDYATDTIFALATPAPPPRGSGIAIIRLSGPDAFSIAGRLSKRAIDPDELEERKFRLVDIVHEGHEIDRAGILGFHGPHSYTGEDVIEFHLHGGLAVIRALEESLLKMGVRPAEPGEFTRRAFLNGRMDLIQAEAVAALVGASGVAAQKEALRQRSGMLSEKIGSLRVRLRDILARLEVDFDYPEERVDGIENSEAIELLDSILADLKPLLASWEKGSIISGFRLAIIGLPNVGKSSLLNALLEEDRAIVTSTPGTTRDVVSATLTFGGVPAELLDTAGIRIISDQLDTVESEGIRRSWREIERAHLVLMVFDTSIPLDKENIKLIRRMRDITVKTGALILLVCNKNDLAPAWEPSTIGALIEAPELPGVVVSAKTRDGIDKLRSNVRGLLHLEIDPEEILLTETRHRALIEESAIILGQVRDGVGADLPQDVAATELWGADRAFGRLLGEGLGATDLDEIFSRFCIGK